MKQLWVLLLVVIFAVVLLSCGGDDAVVDGTAAEPAAGVHPVVIVAIDGLRADALGCYGAPAATPAFDALAAESVRFEWAYSQAPEMMPSLASVLSGLYPRTNGMLTAGDDLEAEAVTLAEVAAAAGMTTAAFVEGAPGGADFGLAQGFGSYQTVAAPGAAGVAWMQQHAKDDFLLLIAGWGSRSLEGAAKLMGDDNEGIGDRVVEVLASRDGDSPVMFNDDEMARIREWYAARVQVIDAAVADFMAVFHETGLADRATLVVMGTNGLALAEHDDLFGETVYAPVTRVPMLLRFPGGADAGANTKVVEALDVMPTLVERLGVELPTGVQGSSLMPLITGASTPPYVAFGEGPGRGGQRFVALAGYRAVVSGADTKSELFHTASDPLELEDIADAEPDKLTKLQGDLEAWTKMVSIASLNPELRTEADLDDDTLKQLKSLGYVQ